MTGTSHSAVKLRCALACETSPGAYAQNSPPATAAHGLDHCGSARLTPCRDPQWSTTSRRARNQYQAYPVAARLPVSATRNATGAPSVSVTGASRTPSTVTPVLTARFTPSGTFSRSVHSGLWPCTTACAAYDSSHSNSAWSPALTRTARWFGSVHMPAVTQNAAASDSAAAGSPARVHGRVACPTAGAAPTCCSSTNTNAKAISGA